MNELVSAISLCMIVTLLLVFYNRYRVDKVRQDLFALRDELFDEARAGHISFDSAAYAATRTTINGAIRFAHRLSFSRLIAFRLLAVPRVGRDEFAAAMSASSAEDRVTCKNYMNQADIIVISYVLSSPLVLALVVPQVLMMVLARMGWSTAEAVLRRCKAEVAAFNKLAYQEGRAA